MLSEKDEHTLTESLDKEQGEFDVELIQKIQLQRLRESRAINAEKLDFRGDLLNKSFI